MTILKLVGSQRIASFLESWPFFMLEQGIYPDYKC